MQLKKLHTIHLKIARGSLTVEAAIIVPIILLCILWMIEGGIILYAETAEVVKKQEMWDEFHPAKQFRKLELLDEVIDAVK